LTEQGDEPQLWLDYVPNIVAPIVFAIAFGVVFIAHVIHFVRHKGMYFWSWMLLGLAGL
jgi:urease accessory protein UreF